MTERTPEELLKLIPDWFISPELRKRKDSAHYMRATIILGVVIMSSFFDIILIIALWLSPYPENPEHKLIALSIATIVLICYLASLGYYKLRQTIVGPSNLYAIGVLCATSLPGFITGGFLHSPNLQIIIVIPVWSFLMAGRRNGLIWALISILTITSYYLAEIYGIAMPQTIPEDTIATIKLLTWLVAISLVVVCLFIYEMSVAMLTNKLNEKQRKLAYEASHDALTGLLNRKALQKCIDLAIEANRRHDQKSAVFYIDLDDFKPINDGYGHSVGDEVLTIVTAKLRTCIRTTDTVARIGGDEFAIVLNDIQKSDVVDTIANKIKNTLSEKISLRDNFFQISASIGVAFIPQNGTVADTVLSCADTAMYEAKRKKNYICYFDKDQKT